MDTATENVRKLPGDLEFLTPQCPICAEHTEPDDLGFDCLGCGISWNKRGENPRRIDPDAKQCGSLYTPSYNGAPEYRCWQDDDHEGDHHNPESFYGWATSHEIGRAAD